MANLKTLSIEELEKLNRQLLQEQNEVLKELMQRGWGKRSLDQMEHSSMTVTENDF
ncbi:hypothetical protein LSG31_16980 [Fodinisporobacter ferrooxydans]|uniref:Transposase n=1 Tax=Fodinisporobacter ferrooxydans TaxID=2901836 RepID=A0ABY4CGY7_9BACL|nr:hypothetical protein LSG31_16980 [Alicyclobacillaceae bacterium MYW30-H2]